MPALSTFGEHVAVFVGGRLTFEPDADSDPALVEAALRLGEYADDGAADTTRAEHDPSACGA